MSTPATEPLVSEPEVVRIEVNRYDYATCREPVAGLGHCNAAVALYQTCAACVARRAGGLQGRRR